MRTESPALTATPTTSPGSGAATWFGSFGSALGVSRTAEASERSTTSTSRGWPLSSKKTVRLPSACGSPTATSLTISVLPGSISTGFSTDGSGPWKKIEVGRIDVSEYDRSCAARSGKTRG